jgi:hypothetical protein
MFINLFVEICEENNRKCRPKYLASQEMSPKTRVVTGHAL